MVRFLTESGPLIWPILLLTGLIVALTLWSLAMLLIPSRRTNDRRRHSIDAVLFWGTVAAVLGFLGQWLGIHKMTQVVAERGIVSPRAVSIGLSESLLTPVAGLAVLVFAGFLWFLLRVGLWRIEQRR